MLKSKTCKLTQVIKEFMNAEHISDEQKQMFLNILRAMDSYYFDILDEEQKKNILKIFGWTEQISENQKIFIHPNQHDDVHSFAKIKEAYEYFCHEPLPELMAQAQYFMEKICSNDFSVQELVDLIQKEMNSKVLSSSKQAKLNVSFDTPYKKPPKKLISIQVFHQPTKRSKNQTKMKTQNNSSSIDSPETQPSNVDLPNSFPHETDEQTKVSKTNLSSSKNYDLSKNSWDKHLFPHVTQRNKTKANFFEDSDQQSCKRPKIQKVVTSHVKDCFNPMCPFKITEEIQIQSMIQRPEIFCNSQFRNNGYYSDVPPKKAGPTCDDLYPGLYYDDNLCKFIRFAPLCMAIRSGCSFEMIEILTKDNDVNETDTIATPLYYAVEKNRLEVVDFLLAHGANVNQHNLCNGYSPFAIANEKIKQVLLNYGGVELNLYTELFEKCEKGQLTMEDLSGIPDVDQLSHHDNSLMTIAIEKQQYSMVELLLNAGSNVNRFCHRYYSPLMLAVQYPCVKITNLLISRGASLNQVNECDHLSALEFAIQSAMVSQVYTLLRHGADPNFSMSSNKSHPIHQVNDDIPNLNWLLAFDADVNRSNANDTPIFSSMIASNNQEGIQMILRQSSLNIHYLFQDGQTYLHMAIRANNMYLLKRLIAKGIDVNLSYYKITPLCLACERNQFDFIKVLVQNGANVNMQMPKNKKTALHFAVENRHLPTIRFLLQHGADLSICAQNGISSFNQIILQDDVELLTEIQQLSIDRLHG